MKITNKKLSIIPYEINNHNFSDINVSVNNYKENLNNLLENIRILN
jgi:hypothetical protein